MPEIYDVVLGLDASLTHTGSALLAISSDEHSEQTFKPKTLGVTRLLEVEKWLENLMAEVTIKHYSKVKYVMLEGYAYSAFNQAHQMGELGGIIRRFFYLRNIPIRVVSPKTLKKWITGRGDGDKNLILVKAFRKWGIEFSDDHTCDAFGLAKLGKAMYYIETGKVPIDSLAQFEREVIKVVEASSRPKPPKKKKEKKQKLIAEGV